jgi:hypothetical protein
MRGFRSLAALGLLIALPGCAVAVVAGVGAGAAALKYAENEFSRDYVLDLPIVWDATIQALRELGYELPSDVGHDLEKGEIETDDLNVVVERFPGQFTRLSVRVGTFHSRENEKAALEILETTGRILARRPYDPVR